MNILILGCSFGVPGNGCPIEYHTENQLKLQGHYVFNCARNGSSNLESLAIAKKMLEKSLLMLKFDWIIWFHTELIRDASFLFNYKKKSFTLHETADVVYNDYKEFVKEQKVKLAIIGGAAPVHPKLFDYIQPDFCVTSWFNQILNLDLPQIQTLSRLDIVEKLQGIGSAVKFDILLQHEKILDALEASEDFPDNYHPGIRPHVELAAKLHETFLEK